jgi:hypothetical protein
MKSDLTVQDQQYINDIMDILKSSGVSPTYREDTKIQLSEYIQEAKLQNEDYLKDLGTPEDFALQFMDTADTKEAVSISRIENDHSYKQGKKTFPYKSLFSFSLLACIYYLISQFVTALTLTTSLAPGEYGSDFHLFSISDNFWWNLLWIGINITIAFVLSALSVKLLSRRYR